MLKTLHLPIWLTSSTTFYVDKSHANASNTLSEGRGLSPSLPFKTVQAAADYVAQNYNVSSYGAIIDVAAGDYTGEGNISLGSFARTTGSITLRGRGPSQTFLPRVGCRSTAPWEIESLRVKPVPEAGQASASYAWAIGVVGENDNIGNLRDVTIDLSEMTDWTKLYYAICVFGTLRIEDDSKDTPNGISIKSGGMQFSSVIHTSGGSINNYADINVLDNLHYTAFATSSLMGKISILHHAAASNPGRPPIVNVNGHTCVGKRYSCITGGVISTGAAGPDYFPGNAAGTVDASTYSWYN